jgi:hypothetical protein
MGSTSFLSKIGLSPSLISEFLCGFLLHVKRCLDVSSVCLQHGHVFIGLAVNFSPWAGSRS